MPRRYARQTHRNNVPSTSDKEYFKRAIYLPYLDELIQQLDMRFGQEAVSIVRALSILPSRVHLISQEMENDIYVYYNADMPSPETFSQEMKIWKSIWENQPDKPESITSTLTDVSACPTLFPNIMTVLFLLALTSVTSSSTERYNSSLKLIKNDLRSTMKEDGLNAPLLLYVHRDINLDYDKIIDDYAMRNPRKTVLMNPL
ncbi:unnamed protein product [Mytilus coruscus]|uniref:HAT C-terminal dimerisation domain-containing protein n=1 Tax=Mytilus coruscus TaxID=42192 RepID=A0A6J8ABN5_MYTCO|nr:unnamed protein product [Mytilus coruscus]